MSEPAPDDVDLNEPSEASGGQFSLATLFLLLTLAALCFALMVREPGLGIGLAILSLPAFLRTAMLVGRRRELGRPTSPVLKITSYVGSLLTVVLVSAVVLIASVGTFCTVCIGLAKNMSDEGPVVVALLLAGTATVAAIYGVVAFIRWRWRRDVDRK
jgi:hypothetical protein